MQTRGSNGRMERSGANGRWTPPLRLGSGLGLGLRLRLELGLGLGLELVEYLPVGGGRPESRRAPRDGTLIITPARGSGWVIISGSGCRAGRCERIDCLVRDRARVRVRSRLGVRVRG